jgi:hypothetical protein
MSTTLTQLNKTRSETKLGFSTILPLTSNTLSATTINKSTMSTIQKPVISITQFKKIQENPILPHLPKINLLRQHYLPIMYYHNNSQFRKSQLDLVNACRLYLKITTSAEITNDHGKLILCKAITGAHNETGKPLLWK